MAHKSNGKHLTFMPIPGISKLSMNRSPVNRNYRLVSRHRQLLMWWTGIQMSFTLLSSTRSQSWIIRSSSLENILQNIFWTKIQIRFQIWVQMFTITTVLVEWKIRLLERLDSFPEKGTQIFILYSIRETISSNIVVESGVITKKCPSLKWLPTHSTKLWVK